MRSMSERKRTYANFVPDGYDVRRAEVLDEMSSPRFDELEPERAVFDGKTLVLGKYACASAFYVILSPAAK